MFAALSEQNPTIEKYLNKFIAMAPIFYFTNQSCKLIDLFEWIFTFQGLLFDAHIYHVFESGPATSHFLAEVCRFSPSLCGFGFEQISDSNPALDYSDR